MNGNKTRKQLQDIIESKESLIADLACKLAQEKKKLNKYNVERHRNRVEDLTDKLAQEKKKVKLQQEKINKLVSEQNNSLITDKLEKHYQNEIKKHKEEKEILKVKIEDLITLKKALTKKLHRIEACYIGMFIIATIYIIFK